jgi:hypothetical protein
MKTTKNISIIIIALLLLIAFSACSNDGKQATSDSSSSTTYDLYINVKFEANLMFSTYDAEVYVDDNKLGAGQQGNSFSTTTTLSEGKHEIIFYKSGDKSVKGSTTIKMDNDKAFSCEIKAHNNSIDINNQKEEPLKDHLESATEIKTTEKPQVEESTQAPTKAPETEPEVDLSKLDQYKGKCIADVIEEIKALGYETKYISTNANSDLTYDIDAIADKMYFDSYQFDKGSNTLTIYVTPEHIIENDSKEKELSETISKNSAWVAANYYGKEKYKKFTLHYLVSPLRAEPNEDGTAWELKAPCTVNGVEMTCEATVGGTEYDPKVLDFIVY